MKLQKARLLGNIKITVVRKRGFGGGAAALSQKGKQVCFKTQVATLQRRNLRWPAKAVFRTPHLVCLYFESGEYPKLKICAHDTRARALSSPTVPLAHQNGFHPSHLVGKSRLVFTCRLLGLRKKVGRKQRGQTLNWSKLCYHSHLSSCLHFGIKWVHQILKFSGVDRFEWWGNRWELSQCTVWSTFYLEHYNAEIPTIKQLAIFFAR